MSTFRQKVQATTDWGRPHPIDELQKRPEKPVGRRSANHAQITGHRLFPAFAALWLAALFGLGSLAISSQLLGALVTAIGLPALVPAAAPPLGFTAHVLVALLLTVFGGGLGLVIGLRLRPKKVGAPRSYGVAPAVSEAADSGVPKVRARDSHPDAPPRRPLVLTEAFGDSAEIAIEDREIESRPVEAPKAPTGPLLRRKPGLASAEMLSSEPETWIPVYTPGGETALPPLDLSEIDAAEIDAAEIHATEQLPPFSPHFAMSAPFEPAAAPFFEPAEEAAPAAYFGPTSEQVSEQVIEPATQPAPVATLLAATPQIPSGLALPMLSREQLLPGEPWSPVAAAPLEGLGLVQLIERLALAIAARKAASHAGPPPHADADADADADASGPKEAEIEIQAEAEATPGPFVSPVSPADFCEAPTADSPASEEPFGSARDAIMRRLGAVTSQTTAKPAPAPFSRPAAPAPVTASVAAPQVYAVVPMRRTDFSANPFAAPVIVNEIAASAQAPIETDEALRSALATLQRMSARA